MVDIVNLISQNGIAIVCVAYLIYFQAKTMSKIIDTLSTIDDRLLIIESNLGISGKELQNEAIKRRAKTKD